MPDEKTHVSPGSVTKYKVAKGIRWRWQAFVANEPGPGKSDTTRVGAAGFSTRRAAQNSMSEALHHFKTYGLPGVSEEPTKIRLFSDVTRNWFDSLDLANSTLAGYRKIIRNHLEPYLGSIPVSSLTVEHLNDLYRHLSKEGRKDSKLEGEALKANTVNKCHQVVRAILDHAVTHEIVLLNVARSPKLVVPSARAMKSQKAEIEVWTIPETKAVLEWNEKIDMDDLNVLWRLYATTGIRRGEGIALKWKDIDFDNSVLKVVRSADPAVARATKSTKTYRQRSIDLDQETLRYLRLHREMRAQLGREYVAASSYVFGTINNELRGPNDVTRRFAKMVGRAQRALAIHNLPWVTLQGLRHGHATHLLQQGIQPKVVQERLGHSNIQTTMDIYSHVLPTIQKDAVNKLWAAWGDAEL